MRAFPDVPDKPQHPYLMQRDPPFITLECYFILLLPGIEQFWSYFFSGTQALTSSTQLHFTGPSWLWVRPCSVFGSLCYLSETRLAQGSWLGESSKEGEGTKCFCEKQAAKEVSITCCKGAVERERRLLVLIISVFLLQQMEIFPEFWLFSFVRGWEARSALAREWQVWGRMEESQVWE